jgi:hypothetical protein
MNTQPTDIPRMINARWKRLYKSISMSLSILFGVVGLLFLFLPEGILVFFNNLSTLSGFPKSPVQSASLFVILAVGYMYLVTIVAYFMYKNPENTVYPLLLIHGKSASSILSLFFFIFFAPYFIFLVNGIVDGLIALGVFLLSKKIRGALQ